MSIELQHLGRSLVVAGVLIAALGGLLLLADRLPWAGRLPGDILIRKKGFTLYFPLATGIALSLLLSLLFWLFGRR